MQPQSDCQGGLVLKNDYHIMNLLQQHEWTNDLTVADPVFPVRGR